MTVGPHSSTSSRHLEKKKRKKKYYETISQKSHQTLGTIQIPASNIFMQ